MVRTLQSALSPVIESLEGRNLFAATTIQTLPFSLDFGADRGELLDRDGQGTGFTRVQTNRLGTQYNASLIDLDTTAGVLKITTSGNSAAGGNYNGDNTLVNGLETQFNATTTGWSVTARLKGPLSYIDNPAEQAGIMFGPDQDNYVKLVAAAQPGGGFVQFIDEQTTNGVHNHALAGSNVANTYTNVGSFASITSLDLRLVGDAATGKVTAFYAVNGGAFVKISAELTLTGSKKTAFFSTAARAGLIAMHKNDLGAMTATFDKFEITAGTTPAQRPSVISSDPANGQINVHRDTTIRNSVYLPTAGAGVDESSLTSTTVRLVRTSDGTVVPGQAGTSGGGDVINFAPDALLDANTHYTFVIDGARDTSGATFLRYEISFTTGTQLTPVNTNYSFEKVALNSASGHSYTAVKMGPDGKLYAATLEGLIQRFSINANGTLGAAENITSLQTAEGGNRFLTGIAFDPASTASNLILWATHSIYAVGTTVAQDWTGKISKLTGPNLATVSHVVQGLPRSVRDHTTNQIAFSPVDGKLYFTQGSQSAMGAPDNAWGLRPEHLLSGAVLRLDPSKIAAGTTLDVKTEAGGTYNPFAANAPLTIYGRGVRNAYDLLFHSNGRLYVPTNGSAPGGNTPAGGGAPALNDVREVMNDYLFDVVQGGYYGHPNPLLGHYVLNGGNPSGNVDPGEVVSYPVGTQPDPNYKGFAYDFGENQSPNGVIEYNSGGTAFGGTLDGKILVVRYSIGGGQDVIALTPGADGSITGVNVNIPGLTTFDEPLDIEVNRANGFIYVVEHGGQKITLARPITPGANAEVDKKKLVFNDTTSSGTSQTQTVTVKNTGTGPLVLGTDAFSVTGTDALRWTLPNKPTTSITLQPGESIAVQVRFMATAVRMYNATLVIKTSDPDSPTINVVLRGLGTSGTGGSNEPSLQRVLDLHQIPIVTGDKDALTTVLYDATNPLNTPNDELDIPRFVKAGSGPVTMEMLAVFGAQSGGTTFRAGYYTPGNPTDKTQVFTLSSSQEQTVAPVATGPTFFDPGSAAFGLYVDAPKFGDRAVYSEDLLNTWDPDATNRNKVRVYALKDGSGAVVPNAYVVAFEEAEYNTPDNQDVVYIIRNVKAAAAGAEIGTENLDGAPYNDRMIFARISTPNSTFPNYFKDTGTVRIRNTGSSDLTINGLSLNNTGWELVNAPAGSFTVPANGGFVDVTLRFKATTGTVHTGTLTIMSSDADEPNTVIQLAGWRQSLSENPEPTLQQHMQLLGYGTTITKTGQTLNNAGVIEAVGDEVLSPYWKRADASKTIGVRQLSAYHTQGDKASVRFHTKGSTTATLLYTHAAADGQTFLPRQDGTLAPTFGTFSHSGTFGFRVDAISSNPENGLLKEWSDPAMNTAGDGGHHIRFFVAKDASGKVIPDAYFMAVDYAAINYDYQDNLYLVTNIKPEFGPAAPTGLTAADAPTGVALNWNDHPAANVRGYNVYRSDSEGGTYAKLNGAVITTSDYIDTTAPNGVASYYRIVAVDLAGTESSPASISFTRGSGSDTTPPAAPTGLVLTPSLGGILLDWADNAEADFAGYQVWRATSANGPFTKLNASLLSGSTYNDTTAPAGQVSYYAIFAIDSSGNASAATNGQATRPSNVSAPAAPSGLTASAKNSGIALDWANNVESDIAGYDVYRATSAGGTYQKINTSLITTSAYFDASAPRGATSFYQVVAINTGGVQSQPASISMARPAQAPYKGNPFAIGATPITIQAEDYDLGGNNIAYFDTDATTNRGGAYRTSEGVDIKTIAGTTGQYRISDAIQGEWMEYTTEVGASGTYLMEFRVGSRDAGAKFHVELNGVNISGILTVPVTGSFDSFTTMSVPVQFTAGEQVLRFVFDSPGSAGYGAAFDWMKVTQQDVSGPVAPAAPAGLTATGTQGGNQLQWNDNAESDLAGYYVERASSAGGTYSRISGSTLLTESEYLDTTAPAGATSYYRVVAVSTASLESTPASTSATRPAAPDTTAPAVPSGASAVGNSSGIALDWSDNNETDFAGYRLYRSDTLGGTYTLVDTGGLLTASSYSDTSMPAGATRFYKLTAVDTTGNESAQTTAFSGTRTGGVTGTVTLGATADATVRGGTSASINYGQAATLEIKGGSDINFARRAFLKFDLTGVTSITDAKVRLFGYLADSTRATAVNLHAVSDDSWTENGITYANAPALGGVIATNTVTGANPGAAAWYEFDVTAHLQAAIAAGETQVSIAIATTASVRVAFSSAEATANQPALVLTT